MDAKEALEYIEIEVSEWERDCQSKHPTKEALKVAIDAIKKQIPVKPLITDKSHLYFGCSSCNHTVEIVQDYCESCGQKIDWSDWE